MTDSDVHDDPSSTDQDEGDGPGFAVAMAELTDIVAELESDAIDVDHLAARVGRAAFLVGLCRERIDGARFAVEEILRGLETEDLDQAES